jgi:diguanylate cyclase (GGDEF)-like protein/PAS domain S-box-containing protein
MLQAAPILTESLRNYLLGWIIGFMYIDQNTKLIEIASRDIVQLNPQDNIGAAAAIMSARRISSIVISDQEGWPVGIVTERDILSAVQSGVAPDALVQGYMTSPLITVAESINCIDAYQLCLKNNIKHLVITDDRQQLVGIVTETDFRAHFNLMALSGRRNIASIMSQSVFSLAPDASLSAAIDLMQQQKINCVVVAENRYPLGVITERDVVRLYSEHIYPDITLLSDVMSRPPLTIQSHQSVNAAAELMLQAKVRHLVITSQNGLLSGLLSEHDITKFMTFGFIEEQQLAKGQLLHALISTIPDLIWLKDPQGYYLSCNPPFEQFYGASEQVIVGKTDYDFVTKEQADMFRFYDRKVVETKQASINEEHLVFIGKDYQGIFETIKTPLYDQSGVLLGVLGIARDISERKRIEARLRINASVFSNTQEGILICDGNNTIIEVNPAFTRITGYSHAEALGRNPKMLSSGRHDAAFYRNLWDTLAQQKFWRGEIWNRRKCGEIYAQILSISVIEDEYGRVIQYVAVFSDITYLKAHEEALSRAANYDILTGIPNRLLLADRMAQAMAQTRRERTLMAVCYLDLDGFKPVNDQLGHEAGDAVLINVAKRIECAIRSGDTIARLGGDEFVVLLLGLNSVAECLATITRLHEAIAMPMEIKNQLTSVSASIGVCFYPGEDDNAETLLRHADQAMYTAKHSGKSRYHLYDQTRNYVDPLDEG